MIIARDLTSWGWVKATMQFVIWNLRTGGFMTVLSLVGPESFSAWQQSDLKMSFTRSFEQRFLQLKTRLRRPPAASPGMNVPPSSRM